MRSMLPPPTPTMIIDDSYGDAEETIEPQRSACSTSWRRARRCCRCPPDGRAPDIAMFLLEAGFDVAIDDEVRSVATMLTQAARESARPESIPRARAADPRRPRLDGEAPSRRASWWRTAAPATPVSPAR